MSTTSGTVAAHQANAGPAVRGLADQLERPARTRAACAGPSGPAAWSSTTTTRIRRPAGSPRSASGSLACRGRRRQRGPDREPAAGPRPGGQRAAAAPRPGRRIPAIPVPCGGLRAGAGAAVGRPRPAATPSSRTRTEAWAGRRAAARWSATPARSGTRRRPPPGGSSPGRGRQLDVAAAARRPRTRSSQHRQVGQPGAGAARRRRRPACAAGPARRAGRPATPGWWPGSPPSELPGPGRVPVEHVQRHPGLHGDHGEPVADDVVQRPAPSAAAPRSPPGGPASARAAASERCPGGQRDSRSPRRPRRCRPPPSTTTSSPPSAEVVDQARRPAAATSTAT